MRKLFLMVLALIVIFSAGCNQPNRETDSEPDILQEEENESEDPTDNSEGGLYYPPNTFDHIERAEDGFWEVVQSEWVLDRSELSTSMVNDNNLVTTEEYPTRIEPPYIVGDDGEQFDIPNTEVHITTNPKTGKQILATRTYIGKKEGNEYLFDYIVMLDNLILYETKEIVPGPGSPGLGFRWVGEEYISVSGSFTDFYLYNITDQTYLALTYPLPKPTKEKSVPLLWDRESLTQTDCTYLEASQNAYIVTHIDGTDLEDEAYARDYGAGRQTLYYVNWETGQTFPFYENDYKPQGAGRPEYLNIGIYHFDDAGNFVFIAGNRYGVSGLGEDIGQVVYYVDVANETTREIITVPFGVMEAGVYGDYIVFITSFYSDSDYYAYLYNYKENTIAKEFRGEYHGSYLEKYPVFLDRENNVVRIFDVEKKKEYQLSLDELSDQIADYTIEYNVHKLTIRADEKYYRIDYAELLGLTE